MNECNDENFALFVEQIQQSNYAKYTETNAFKQGATILYEYTCYNCDGQCEFRCNECNGKGEYRCSECKGKGEVRCFKCLGKGGSVCRNCDGTGYTRYSTCSYCKGDGITSCP